MQTSITPPINIPIFKWPTNEVFHLVSVDDSFIPTPKDLNALVKICNQPPIYDRLFKHHLNSTPYTLKHAKDFFEFAHEGWKNKNRFVFLIKDNLGQITGQVDIKSPNQEAQIGYWVSSEVSGIMTSAINELLKIATLAGYKTIFATPNSNNQKSINLLLRLGFIQKPTSQSPFLNFQKTL